MTHCRYLNDKIDPLFAKLGRLAANEWGFRHCALREIYRGVFTPTTDGDVVSFNYPSNAIPLDDVRNVSGTLGPLTA